MKYSFRMIVLSLTGIVAIGVAASGCATPWFATSGAEKDSARSKDTPPAGDSRNLAQATITYLNGLCRLSKEQRDASFRELNEALLPNHATLSCGPGSER